LLRSFAISNPHQILLLFGRSNEEELDWLGMLHVWETGKMHTGFWCGDLRENDQLEYVGVDVRTVLKGIFKNWNEMSGMDR
jgi:hypothetical protein